jgi:transcriptional regulator with XRE-family HTH domain
MKDRIQKLISEEKITAAEFADKIGVQRSNVSHILNGRNNPGFSFIQKILESFPAINPRWLITGVGNMYGVKENYYENSTKPKDFDSIQKSEQRELNQKTDFVVNSFDISEKPPKNINIEKLKGNESESKKVIKVLFFYADHTFEDFLPAEKI